MTKQDSAMVAEAASQALPLVLVHGYLGGAAQWADVQAALSAQRPTIAISLPGFGQASQDGALSTIEEFADHVIAQLDAKGIDRFDLMGHSMGGMIAQEVARKVTARVDRLVLYGTGPLGLMPDRFEPLSTSLQRLHEDGVSRTVRRIVATWFVNGETHPQFAQLAQIGEQASSQAAELALNAMAAWDGRAALAQITVPTLVVWGDRDRSYKWDQVANLWRGLPSASLAVIPAASHVAHAEKPEIFNLIIADFLQR